MSMVNLYCLTNGRFLDNLKPRHEYILNSNLKSILFNELDFEYVKTISQTIKNDGYSIFKNKLDNKVIDELKSLSFKLKAKVGEDHIHFDPKNKRSNIYKFEPNELINDGCVQELIMDPILINIARQYLGSEPIFDFVAMWWSTDSKNKNDDAAQEYHFDLDRMKWLKIFVYLNDVDENNGPHCYISGSHKVGNKPQKILDKGYVRISDSELHKYYKKNDFKEITGAAGTVVFGDTSCWHKGKPIVKGDRLILQLEYTTSLFGLNMPKFQVSRSNNSFANFCEKNKHYTKNIQLRS